MPHVRCLRAALLLFGAASAASAAPATYFYAEGPRLLRAQLALEETASSGVSELTPRSVAMVRLPGFRVFHHQLGGEAIAVACREEPQRTDELKDCDVFHVDRAGRALPLGVRAVTAYLLPQGRFVYWTSGLQLWSRALAGGEPTLLARSVMDPVPSADLRQLGVAHAPGAERFELGQDACPAVVELGGAQAREPIPVPGPCEVGSAPFISPGRTRLYVSTRGGLAAFWTQRGSAPAQQRTQVGATEVDERFVPVPGRELVWLSETTAVYTASYATDELWSFDVQSGRAAKLHAGSGPAWVEDGDGRRAVIAVDGRRLLCLSGVLR